MGLDSDAWFWTRLACVNTFYPQSTPVPPPHSYITTIASLSLPCDTTLYIGEGGSNGGALGVNLPSRFWDLE